MKLALIAMLSLFAHARGAQAKDESTMAGMLAELDHANPQRTRALATELIALGDEAAAAALAPSPAEFAALHLDARRARSRIAREGGAALAISAALQRLDDPDESVRRELLLLIANPELRDPQLTERIATLERAALGDLNVEIRSVAIRALARLDALEACGALERCLLAAPARESSQCAQVLAAQPRAREIVVRLVQRAFAGDGTAVPLPSDALETLLESGYGTALAETSSGGTAPRDRVPFVLGAHHADPGMRQAAATALQRFVDRSRVIGEWQRAETVLAALLDSGLDDFELLVERALLALQAGGDAQVARRCALEIRRRWPLDGEILHRDHAVSGALLEAVAAFALADMSAVEPALASAADALDSLRDEQFDQRVDEDLWRDSKEQRPLQRLSEAMNIAARARMQVVTTRALVDVYRVLALLASGRDTVDGGVLARAREADILLLEAQCVAASVTRSRLSLDDLFTHRFGPSPLLFGTRRGAPLAPARALELERELAQVFATVTGSVPGFTPAPNVEPRIADRASDHARLDWLQRIQRARFAYDEFELELQTEEFQSRAVQDENERRELARWRAILLKVHEREREEGPVALGRQMEPSQAGLVLADRLREQGRAEAARALAAKVREDLEALRENFASRFEAERVLATVETTLGGALMDANTPAEAEQSFQSALARLEAIERDPAVRSDERGLALVRSQLSNVLVSLAVNANVKSRRPDKALEYFERAYAMQQSDFMRALLACYRARAGLVGEARAALRDVPIIPGNYYNLGCTYALLGERDLALDFLRRDLDELRGTGGSRERQKEWARGDPDLESLRDDARFQALMRPAEPGSDE